MKKRIASVIGIILILSLYIAVIVAAFTAKKASPGFFAAAFFCSIVIPIMLWWFIAAYKWVHKKPDNNGPDKDEEKLAPDKDEVNIYGENKDEEDK